MREIKVSVHGHNLYMEIKDEFISVAAIYNSEEIILERLALEIKEENKLVFRREGGEVQIWQGEDDDFLIIVRQGEKKLGFDVANIVNGGGDRESWIFLNNLMNGEF